MDPDPNLLSYQWQSRDQQKLELRLADLRSGQQRTLLTETSNTWLNLHDDLHFLANKNELIWASERDGFKHLYLFDPEWSAKTTADQRRLGGEQTGKCQRKNR